MIAVGDKAPLFNGIDQSSNPVDLEDFIGKKALVIYFYPKNFTPGCVAEACSFRDHYQAFTDLGALVIGISADSVASHARFVQKYKLPFTMIADTGNHIRKKYSVKPDLFGLIPGRETFVIDRQGIVKLRFNSLQATKHIPKALDILKTIVHA